MHLSTSALLATLSLAGQTLADGDRVVGCGEGLIFPQFWNYQSTTACKRTQNFYDCDENTRLSFSNQGQFLFVSPKTDYSVAVVCPDQAYNKHFHCTAGQEAVLDNPCGQTADGVQIYTVHERTPRSGEKGPWGGSDGSGN
ncbi:hypothetical protein E4U53_004000 [Claviceps sorghi]|nr:hypothetical protein E4U53_004000 [Claviceps sorghi]